MIKLEDLHIETNGENIYILARLHHPLTGEPMVDEAGVEMYSGLYHYRDLQDFKEFLLWGLDYVRKHETPIPDVYLREVDDAS